MSKNSDDSLVFVVGTLLGAFVGVIGGIIFSPRPGIEMRQDLKKIAKNLSKEVPSDIERVKKSFDESVDKIKDTVEDQIKKLNKSMKADKMASAKQKEEMDTGF